MNVPSPIGGHRKQEWVKDEYYKLSERMLNFWVRSEGFPRLLYEKQEGMSEWEFEKRSRLVRLLYLNQVHERTILYPYFQLHLKDIPAHLTDLPLLQGIRQLALFLGMPAHEFEQLVAWEVRPFSSSERDALRQMIQVQLPGNNQKSLNFEAVYKTYNAVMSQYPLSLYYDQGQKEKVRLRFDWQVRQLTTCMRLLSMAGTMLPYFPVKVASGQYTQTLKMERTQQDLNNEMAKILGDLPQYQAYVKMIDESLGTQLVWKSHMQTYPLPSPIRSAEIEQVLIEKSHQYCKERSLIDEEIRKRQERWLTISRPQSPTGRQTPPASEPPPTRG